MAIALQHTGRKPREQSPGRMEARRESRAAPPA